MACVFSVGKARRDGLLPIFIRVQSKRLRVNVKRRIDLSVPCDVWALPRGSSAFRRWRGSDEGERVFGAMAQIEQRVNYLLRCDVKVSSAQVRSIITDVVYREAAVFLDSLSVAQATSSMTGEERGDETEIGRNDRRGAAASVSTGMNRFIASYRKEVRDGVRLSNHGRAYAKGSVHSIEGALNQLEAFQVAAGREYDFDDIDMSFYYDFTAFLKRKCYSVNTIGKCVRVLKSVMACAQMEGLHCNVRWRDKRFRCVSVGVDAVYLSREELDRMMGLELSGKDELVRDVFMVGVWTAQRVSDFNGLGMDDVVRVRGRDGRVFTYINIRQRKTGTRVAVPCSGELMRILGKYGGVMPRVREQMLNARIKVICRMAGIDDVVKVECTKGGVAREVVRRKWEMVHSHTARRTGATLMYLSGMDVLDIMKVTGHSSEQVLRRYIRADELEVVEKIVRKYRYFD